jgi:hypothetical protein
MALSPNPFNTKPSVRGTDQAVIQEYLLANWTEPQLPKSLVKDKRNLFLGIGGLLIIGLLIIMGYWQKNNNYYFGAIVFLVAAFSLYIQYYLPHKPMDIVITNLHLQVGRKTYSYTDLAGFWYQEEFGYILVNIEPKKASITTISFLYPSSDKQEVRNLFLKVIPEVEPRIRDINDQISDFLNF